MRKKVFGRKFKRDKNERKALFKGLVTALILHDRIETTEEKAKAIRPLAEKLVTKAKKHGDNAVVHLQDMLAGDALRKMMQDIAPRFTNRSGGYTRIIKTQPRVGDKAAMAIIEWTEISTITSVVPTKKAAGTKKISETKAKKTVAKKAATKKVTKKKA